MGRVKYLIFSILLLTGCSEPASILTQQSTIIRATCYMDGFDGFPKKITGQVSFQLKSYLTLVIHNKKKTEKIEMTFLKSKCKVK